MKWELVKFEDGKFAVRRRKWFRYIYADKACDGYEWDTARTIHIYCKTDEAAARELLLMMTDKGEVVE